VLTARIITRRGTAAVDLGDCGSLDEAIGACWRDFGSLDRRRSHVERLSVSLR